MKQDALDFELTILAINRLTFLSTQEKFILLNKLDSIQTLSVLSIKDIMSILKRPSKAVFNPVEIINDAKKDLFIINKLNIKYVLYTDENYPELLKEIADPPFMLFYRGDISVLNSKNNISVVGTRKIVRSAIEETYKFAYEACLDNVNIVSGLALGVDKQAHLGAINAFYDSKEKSIEQQNVGRTIAVLPCGIDTITPDSNKRVAQKILETGGCIISEYPPQEAAKKYRFVQRNRIIAGLSNYTLVTQAPSGSGAMITAHFAVDYAREVVIHEVNFCQESQRFNEFVKAQLLSKVNSDKKCEYKLKSSPDFYVEDGAQIISSYQDFCAKFTDVCGNKFIKNKNIQNELFDLKKLSI